MANLTHTITEKINVFGPAPSDKWGPGSPYTFTWGVTKWGEGTQDLPVMVNLFSYAETLVTAFAIAKRVVRKFTETQTFGFLAANVTITEGAYNVVFPKPTVYGDQQITTAYSKPAIDTEIYTVVTNSTSNWS